MEENSLRQEVTKEMDITALTTLVSTVGFPIVACAAVGWIFYKFLEKQMNQQQDNMKELQNRCLEREARLYAEIEKGREINKQAIETITICTERLGVIQDNIEEIKNDVVEIKAK